MLRDTAHIRICAGDGGNGAVKFTKGVTKYPSGGNGGKGGDVYVVGSTDLADLNGFNQDQIFQAEHGDRGDDNRRNGLNAKDLIIKLPPVTEIYDQNGKYITTVSTLNQPILIRKGGEGGLGNYHFRKGVDGRFDYFTKGKKGERFNVTLKFKLVADIVFIGLPNVGKSSMLNSLTNANSKVGNYHFTTLNPHLGRLNKLILMDLPGLIEGTYEGKGLGPKFLQHTEYTKLVAHFISLTSENLLADYELIREELKNLDKNLSSKKEIIILTKSDELSEGEIDSKLKELDSINSTKIITSIIDDSSLEKIKSVFIDELKNI